MLTLCAIGLFEPGQRYIGNMTERRFPPPWSVEVAALIGAVLGIVTYYVIGSRWLAVLLCALIGAVHGPVTCYVVGGGWIGILLFGLIGAVVVGGAVSKLRVFR